jgi:hypothetical protein
VDEIESEGAPCDGDADKDEKPAAVLMERDGLSKVRSGAFTGAADTLRLKLGVSMAVDGLSEVRSGVAAAAKRGSRPQGPCQDRL